MVDETPVMFPLNLGGAKEIREALDLAYAQATGSTILSWSLPDASDTAITPAYLRRRRAAGLFMLGLPGRVRYDVTNEVALHDQAGEPERGNKLRANHIETRRRRRGVEHLLERSILQWQYHPCSDSGVLFYNVIQSSSTRDNPWNDWVLGNFGAKPGYVTDGTITLASDDPCGAECLYSDNNWLPADTTIYISPK